MNIARLRSVSGVATGGLLVNRAHERVTVEHAPSVVVAYFAPVPVELATEYHLKG
jgi:hypothetical protein